MEQMQKPQHGLLLIDHASDPPPGSPAGSRGKTFEYPPTADDWKVVRHRIHQMYVIEKRPLKHVRTTLERLGFRATERMIKSRLRSWGYVKNAKKTDWGTLAVLHHQRKTSGKRHTVFEVHGIRKSVRDLHRFIRNQSITPEEFLAEHLPLYKSQEVPEYIRAITPELEDIKPDSPPSSTESSSDLHSPLPTKPTSVSHIDCDSPMLAHQTLPEPYSYHPVTSPDSRYYSRPDLFSTSNALKLEHSPKMTQGTPNISRSRPTQMPTPPSMDVDNEEPCSHMESEFKASMTQLVNPQPLRSRIGTTDAQFWCLLRKRHDAVKQGKDVAERLVCSRCRQPSVQHFTSLDAFELQADSPHRSILNDCHDNTLHLPVSTRDEGAWLWMSRCFLASISLGRGDEKMATIALQDAAKHFEVLLQKKDKMLMTAAVQVTAVLGQHDQQDIALSIMSASKAVADRVFSDPTHPVRTTMTYFTHAANVSFSQQSEINSNSLLDAYQRLKKELHEEHPWVIAARYNYAWMLKYEDKLEDAERNLREVYRMSCSVFTERHLQSVFANCLIAGCLRPQKDRQEECILLYKDVIEKTRETLGESHPYRLEAIRRLAERLDAQPGMSYEVLQLHKEVLWGRAKMLGRHHEYTLGARKQYIKDLQKLDRWGTDDSPTPEQRELRDLYTQDEQDYWTTGNVHEQSASFMTNDEPTARGSRQSISRTPSPAMSDDYAGY